MRCPSSIQEGKRLTMLPLIAFILAVLPWRCKREAQLEIQIETCVERNRDQTQQKASGTKISKKYQESKMAKDSPCHPIFFIDWGTWLQKTPKGFTSEGRGGTYLNFFFGLLTRIRTTVDCRRSVWPGLPDVAAFRDADRLRHGTCFFVLIRRNVLY